MIVLIVDWWWQGEGRGRTNPLEVGERPLFYKSKQTIKAQSDTD